MTSKLKTAILGATGYSGFELVRILLRHPSVETPVMLQRSGEAAVEVNLADMYPAISGNGGYPLQPWSWSELKRREIELLFLATPHEVSRALVPEAIAHGMRVVDLSGAWRLREAQNRAVYGFHDEDALTAADLMEKAVYGLPELNGDRLPGAALVANPGCYATSVILALAPLLAADIVDREKGIISDSKSGASGAGKEATARTHFVSVADNLSAYSVFGHRHVGEILEQLKLDSGELIFTPHLLPIPRGILSTIYVTLGETRSSSEIETAFRKFYTGRPMVRIWQAGSLPELQHVAHTNFCDIGFSLDNSGKRLIVVSCLDNLGKGAAGQAVQNFNLTLGIEEQTALQ